MHRIDSDQERIAVLKKSWEAAVKIWDWYLRLEWLGHLILGLGMGAGLLTSLATFWAAVAQGLTPLYAIFLALFALLLVMLASLAILEVTGKRRPKYIHHHHATVQLSGVEAKGGIGTSKPAPEQPVEPPTLEKLFDTDFPFFAAIEDTTVNFTNANTGVVERADIKSRYHQDPTTGAKFLSFFVPLGPLAYQAAAAIPLVYNEIISRADGNMSIRTRQVGENQSVSHSGLKFTGTVYVYCYEDFDLKQQGQLASMFEESGLNLRLRGPTYLQASFLRLNREGAQK